MMEFLRLVHKKNAVEQTVQQQPEGGNRPKATRRLSRYSWLVILAGALLIGSLWLFVRYQVNFDHGRTMQEASRQTMNLAKAFEEHVRRVVADADKDLLNLQMFYEREGAGPSIDTFVEIMGKDQTRVQAAVINEQGILVASFIKQALGTNIADRKHFQFHRGSAAETLHIGQTIMDRTDNIIPLSRRVNKLDGSFGGIAYIGLKASYFSTFYETMDAGGNALFSMIGTDGRVRTHIVGGNLRTGQDISSSFLGQKIQSGLPNGVYVADESSDGVKRLVSFRAIPDYPLIVAAGISVEAALKEFEGRKRGYILGSSLISLFILAFCGLLISRAAQQRRLNTELDRRVAERTQELQAQEKELSAVNHKLAETNAVVQQERDWLFALINSISAEVWFVDTQKKVTLVNPAVMKEFCLSPAEMNVEDLVCRLDVLRSDGSPRPVEEAPLIRALYGEVITGEIHLARTPASGKYRYREVNCNPVRDADGNIIGSVSIVHDITERKAMEDEIKKHRDNLQTLVEEQVRELNEINTEMTAIFTCISDPFFALDKQWRLIFINKMAAQMADIRLNEAHIGQIIWQLFPDLVGGEIYQNYHKARAANTPIHTLFQGTVSGKLFDVNIYPYANGLFVYMRDVTEQKKYEAEIARLDRLNLIGEMAASIGHEVRNPMTTVRGYLQRFDQKAAFVEYREQLALMIEELDRANSIITEFLSLAKNKTIKLKSTNLNTVIRSIFPLLQADAFRRGSTIEMELEDTPEIFLDDSEIRQCILNLVSNGMDAMPQGGKITISTAKAENQVVMTVRDRGTGIPSEIKEKLGTPFVTTKENGTGLGLPVCYRIAQRHNATIEVETGPEGTVFHFIFNMGNTDLKY